MAGSDGYQIHPNSSVLACRAAPSTALRAVPLARFAGKDKKRSAAPHHPPTRNVAERGGEGSARRAVDGARRRFAAFFGCRAGSHRYVESDDAVLVFRVLDGRRKVTRRICGSPRLTPSCLSRKSRTKIHG
jgi:hypothetical protein